MDFMNFKVAIDQLNERIDKMNEAQEHLNQAQRIIEELNQSLLVVKVDSTNTSC